MAWLCATTTALGTLAQADNHDLPTVTVDYSGASTGIAYEHESVAFTLNRTGDTQMSLTVSVDVAETGDMLGSAGEGLQDVTFAAGDETITLVPQITNDSVDESHSSVTVTLAESVDENYLVGDVDAATVLVRDDDGDLIEVTLDPLDLTVDEGDHTAFEMVATVVNDGTASTPEDLVRLFDSTSFRVAWSTRAIGEAESPGDYPAVSSVQTFLFDWFENEDGRLVLRAVLPSLRVDQDDTTTEPTERFLLLLEEAPGLDGRITLATRPEIDGIDTQTSGVAAVVTIPGDAGKLRLVNGDDDHEGRLEIFYDAEWGTICDDYWTDDDSEVACRQLGYPGAESNTGRFLRAHFGEGTGPIWLDNMLCVGDEDSLLDCPRCCGENFPEIGEHNCKHYEDVGVRCLLESPPSPEPCGGQNRNCGSSASEANPLTLPIASDARELKSFDASDHGLTELRDLATFTSLRRLNLARNRLTDLTALYSLGDLQWLDLADNDIADLAPLAQFADLRYLNLAGNRITDISPLASLHRLQMLVLDHNEVVDLSPLASLTELRQLFVAANHIKDISPLTHVAALERLDLFGNPITDFAVLGNLENLVWSRLPAGTSRAVPDQRPTRLRSLSTR